MPTRPARKDGGKKDNNLAAFEENYGDDAVELDAVPPDVLRQMVEGVILQHTNARHLKAVAKQEASDRATIQSFFERMTEELDD